MRPRCPPSAWPWSARGTTATSAGLALGRLAGTAAAISCLGPLVGGVVEHFWGWRAVMALPALGIVVLPFIWRALAGAGTGARLDLVGAVLVTLTAGGLVLLVQSPSTGIVVAVVGVVLFVVGVPLAAARVRRRPDGFLPVEVVRNPTVVRSSLAAAAVPAAWFAHLIAVPAVMVHEGWEPWQVGLLLVPSALLAVVMPRTAGRVLSRLGASRSLAVAALIASGAAARGRAGHRDGRPGADGRGGRRRVRRVRPGPARPHGRGRRRCPTPRCAGSRSASPC